MTQPATRACPASTSALWRTCWVVPPAFHFSSAATVTPRFHTASRAIGVIDGSEPMQNDQAYFFSDIFLKFYNIIEIIVENKIYNIIKHYIVLK
jgi:hypothetical protein